VTPSPTPFSAADRARLATIVHEQALSSRPEPVQLASGFHSRWFVDVKQALAPGAHLELACRAMVATAEALGAGYDAVGGPTMGADQFSYGIALLTGRSWYVIRKEPKDRGTRKLIEGAPLDATTRCLLLEDVVTTGGSSLKGLDALEAAGAPVAAAVALVDRGAGAAERYAERGVPFAAVFTWDDLGIPRLDAEVPAAAS
jgi:orotate phosphoribosyltransferase